MNQPLFYIRLAEDRELAVTIHTRRRIDAFNVIDEVPSVPDTIAGVRKLADNFLTSGDVSTSSMVELFENAAPPRFAEGSRASKPASPATMPLESAPC